MSGAGRERSNWTPRSGCARQTAMTRKPASSQVGKQETAREARLKAALKANMGRRKAQAKARAGEAADKKQTE